MRSVMNIYKIVPAALIWVMLLFTGAVAQNGAERDCHTHGAHNNKIAHTANIHILNSAAYSNVTAELSGSVEMAQPSTARSSSRHCPVTLSQNHCHKCFDKVILHSALLREHRSDNDATADTAGSIRCGYNIQQAQALSPYYRYGPAGWQIASSPGQRPLNLCHRLRI